MARKVSVHKNKRVQDLEPSPPRINNDCEDKNSSQPFNVSKKRLLVTLPLFFLFPILWLYTSNHRYTDDAAAKFHDIEILDTLPHDPHAFTQGLLYSGNDTLYESTGLYGQSSVREVDLQSGEIRKAYQMKYRDFGEGLALLNKRLFQVTWQTKFGYIYDQSNLKQMRKFSHPMKDGWGLTTDGHNIFGSDGSSTLYCLDADTLAEKYKVKVQYEGLEVANLNELEFIKGEIWANVWMSDCIARISPKDGKVLGWILLHKLRKSLEQAGYSIDVLNGIAWDEKRDRLFVTGKLWPKLYEVKTLAFSQQKIKSLGDIRQECHLRQSKM